MYLKRKVQLQNANLCFPFPNDLYRLRAAAYFFSLYSRILCVQPALLNILPACCDQIPATITASRRAASVRESNSPYSPGE